MTILPGATLSAAPARSGRRLRLRVACNRDELVTRSPALPPSVVRVGSRSAIMPLDPDGGGTWIGANDAGLVCALLNVHDDVAAVASPISRGTIIPPLLGCDRLESMFARVSELSGDRYRPFRLLIVDGRELLECWNHGRTIDHRRQALDRPVLRTASGLGDGLVIGFRSALFERFMHDASDPIAAEDLFHVHQWRGREEVSVRMRRKDARTVSHTVVEIDAATVRVVYRPAEAPDVVSVTVAA